jgi:hypothetical protein
MPAMFVEKSDLFSLSGRTTLFWTFEDSLSLTENRLIDSVEGSKLAPTIAPER